MLVWNHTIILYHATYCLFVANNKSSRYSLVCNPTKIIIIIICLQEFNMYFCTLISEIWNSCGQVRVGITSLFS